MRPLASWFRCDDPVSCRPHLFLDPRFAARRGNIQSGPTTEPPPVLEVGGKNWWYPGGQLSRPLTEPGRAQTAIAPPPTARGLGAAQPILAASQRDPDLELRAFPEAAQQAPARVPGLLGRRARDHCVPLGRRLQEPRAQQARPRLRVGLPIAQQSSRSRKSLGRGRPPHDTRGLQVEHRQFAARQPDEVLAVQIAVHDAGGEQPDHQRGFVGEALRRRPVLGTSSDRAGNQRCRAVRTASTAGAGRPAASTAASSRASCAAGSGRSR
jgi:hypothetical protein